MATVPNETFDAVEKLALADMFIVLALMTLPPVRLPPVPPPNIIELAILALFADMLPITVSRLVDLSNVKLALPLATPASLNMISVLLPATGPVAPVVPM